MSPDLFNLYSGVNLRPLEEYSGIIVHRHNLTHVQYAHETVLIASHVEDLQNLLNCVKERSQKFDTRRIQR